MNRFGRGTRPADGWASAHERARALAAERMDWSLDRGDETWLERHLGDCPSCRAMAQDYLDIRAGLRGLRDATPPPPRDLWARTAAAIERESQRGGSGLELWRRIPLGAASGLLVVVVVLGATLLSNLPSQPVVTPTDGIANVPETPDVAAFTPGSTPFDPGAGDVKYFWRNVGGEYALGNVRVDEVCPDGTESGCPTLEDSIATAVALRADPETIIGSPDDESAVIVGAADSSNANQVIVIAIPPEEPDGTPVPVRTQTPTPASTTATPATSASPGTEPTDAPSTASPDAGSPDPSPDLLSAPPSDLPPTETPGPTPEAIAIASDLIVVGQTAAFSPDGAWFAFTARPADESHGPDIYAWRVGDDVAQPITSDHRSVFASWDDATIVGSRPIEDVNGLPDGAEVEAETFLVDPATGESGTLADTGWRPVVSPARNRAIVYEGILTVRNGGREIAPSSGSLELRRWDPATGALDADAARIVEEADSRFDARWDEDGEAFAVWVEDPADPSFGRLSLFFVDPETGAIEQPSNAPRNEPALAGFSIGKGRLAWATPAGQGGEGSRVQIVAWTDDGVGKAESAPVESVLVIR